MSNKIGICIPYNYSEAAFLGLRIADYLAEHQNNPVVLTDRKQSFTRQSIHPYWDRFQTSYTKETIYDEIKKLDKLVWFSGSYQYDYLPWVMGLERYNVHVALPHQLHEQDVIRNFDATVCLSAEVYAALQEKTGFRRRYIPSDSGMTYTCRERLMQPGKVSFYVPVDTYTVKESISAVVYTLSRALDDLPNVSFTLATYRSVPREIKQTLLELQETGRLVWVRNPNLMQQAKHYRRHDVTLVMSQRSDTGWPALAAFECGAPVIAYDIPPFNEFLGHERNSLLVGCEIAENWNKAVEAKIHTSAMLMEIAKVAEDPTILSTLWRERRNRWPRRDSFRAGWSELWRKDLSGS